MVRAALSDITCRRVGWGWGGLARPAVARSGIDECCGQDFGAAQGVVTAARGLLPSGGGIWCEQMSLAGADIYYLHHSFWWHHLVSARLAVFAHCGRLCVLLGSVEPNRHRDAFAGELTAVNRWWSGILAARGRREPEVGSAQPVACRRLRGPSRRPLCAAPLARLR
jgi:hypothetical protein